MCSVFLQIPAKTKDKTPIMASPISSQNAFSSLLMQGSFRGDFSQDTDGEGILATEPHKAQPPETQDAFNTTPTDVVILDGSSSFEGDIDSQTSPLPSL